MCSAKKHTPFDFLTGYVRVLWVEDEPVLLEAAHEILEAKNVFSVDTAATMEEAIRKADGGRYHVCAVDLGMGTGRFSQYHMVEHYSSRMPVVVVSGHTSITEGAECSRLGAFAVVQKPLKFDEDLLSAVIRSAVLNSLLGVAHSERQQQVCDVTLRLISDHAPHRVEEWALELGVGERHLRKIAAEHGLSAKALVTALTLVDTAICCYWGGERRCGDGRAAGCVHSDSCKRLHSYYYTHMSAINRFLQSYV